MSTATLNGKAPPHVPAPGQGGSALSAGAAGPSSPPREPHLREPGPREPASRLSVARIPAAPIAHPAATPAAAADRPSRLIAAQPNPAADGAAGLAVLFDAIGDDLAEVARIFDAELTTDVPTVRPMLAHVGGFRGKMLRPALVILSGRAAGGTGPHHRTLAAVVEMVHVATLVHDDVLDESRLRRGRASVNQRWGNEAAVLLGDLLISHAYHLCSSVPDHAAARLVGAATNVVCEGELLQVHRRGDLTLSEAGYFDIIRRKTGCLTALSCRLGARWAGAEPHVIEALARYGERLGMAFQIADDVLDLTGDDAEAGKQLGTDLAQGKLTLPLIHLLSATTAPAERRALEGLLTADRPADGIAELRTRLASAGSIAHARRTADRFIAEAVAELSVLPSGPARDHLALAATLVTRRRK